jgi:hypothetical protein
LLADAAIKTGMKRLTTIVVFTFVPFAAAAQSTGVLATKRPITWGMIFALLFLMLGPIKLLGPKRRRCLALEDIPITQLRGRPTAAICNTNTGMAKLASICSPSAAAIVTAATENRKARVARRKRKMREQDPI